MSDQQTRLDHFLKKHEQHAAVVALTADASTREYYRLRWDGRDAVACVYPEPFRTPVEIYLDVTELFLAGGLPVARIFAHDEHLGVVVQEDLGDTIVRDVLTTADEAARERLIDEAVRMIARIQASTAKAFEIDSIASRLRFDTEKLVWELDYFRTHYFGTLRKRPLSVEIDAELTKEFHCLANELATRATVLCHRDFHAANIMIDHEGQMRLIDHQDARIGSPAYDLVSLLLDRVTDLPSVEWISEKQGRLLDERKRLGLGEIDRNVFAEEFELQTIQRCLKAAGTFSYQSAVRGKTHFIPYIQPMFRAAFRAIDDHGHFSTLKRILEGEVNEACSR